MAELSKEKLAEIKSMMITKYPQQDENWITEYSQLWGLFTDLYADKTIDKIIDEFFPTGALHSMNYLQIEVIAEFIKFMGAFSFTDIDGHGHEVELEVFHLLTRSALNSSQMRILYQLFFKLHDENKYLSFYNHIANRYINYRSLNMIAQCMVEKQVDLIEKLAAGIDLRNNQAVARAVNIYDHNQIYEICAGCLSGLDYTFYMDPSLDAGTMGLIRHALELNKDVSITGFEHGDEKQIYIRNKNQE